ncbi:MAG TPA: hypothetical protein VJO99_07130 [Burkholderiaceae bacterium]|nr:hypothetical protein [Burkholderiaceae bacterium]
MSEDNITALPSAAGLPENPLALTTSRAPSMYCPHGAVILDDHTRTVTCANVQCGATLDPFNFLRSNASTIARAWSSYREVSNKASEIAERVHVLKKEGLSGITCGSDHVAS